MFFCLLNPFSGSRGYVVANSTKCLDVSWPYSVSPSSGIIQPVQVMSTPLDIKHCGKIAKHPPVEGIPSNHSSSPVNSGLITPKMEEMKADSSQMLQTDSPHHMSQQHFSPVTTSTVQEAPRQTVLMWGSNHHIQHTSPSTRSPTASSNSTEYSQVPPSEGCEALKSLAEISNPDMCKWNGDATKPETIAQNTDSDSPHHHSTHHSHHNNRVVMVLWWTWYLLI